MSIARGGLDAAALLEAVRSGDPLAIARAITAIENRTAIGRELARAVQGVRGQGSIAGRTLGITGAPGAGKSSLINALIGALLPRYARIGVLTVDPSSPVSGGAVLGDRVRMAAHSADPRIFIRSLATRGHLGGVTRTTRAVIDLLATGGMELVIVETVGTGQSEVEVAELTDVNLLVCAPGLGDEMQAIKAGILEVADLLVVNKSDLPDADRTVAHLQAMLRHRGHAERRSVLPVSTLSRSGLPDLVDAIEARLAEPFEQPRKLASAAGNPRVMLADDVADLAAAMVRDALDPRIERIVEDVAQGTLSRGEAARAAIRMLARRDVEPDITGLDMKGDGLEF